MPEWRDVPGWEDLYCVSDDGQVYSVRSKKNLKPGHTTDGYRNVVLWRDGSGWNTSVHVLVALAFYGPRPRGQQIRHLDGNKENNSKENLKYGSGSENVYDSVRHGTQISARKTHCPQGHYYTQDNTYIHVDSDGFTRRFCRECRKMHSRNYKRKEKVNG